MSKLEYHVSLKWTCMVISVLGSLPLIQPPQHLGSFFVWLRNEGHCHSLRPLMASRSSSGAHQGSVSPSWHPHKASLWVRKKLLLLLLQFDFLRDISLQK